MRFRLESWAWQALGGTLCLSVTPVFARHLGDRYALNATAFLGGLTLVMLPLQALYLNRQRLPVVPQTSGLLLAAVGIGLVATAANLCGFAAMFRAPNTGLPYAVWQTNPVWILLIGALFFGERVRPVQGVGVVLAVVGGALIAFYSRAQDKPGQPWILLSAGWVLLGALMVSLTARLEKARGVSVQTTLAVLFGVMAFACLIVLQGWASLAWLPRPALALLAWSGLFGAAGNILMFSAYSRAANPGLPGAVQSVQPLLIAAGSTLALHHPFPGAMLWGMPLVALGAGLVVVFKAKTARPHPVPVPAEAHEEGEPGKIIPFRGRRS